MNTEKIEQQCVGYKLFSVVTDMDIAICAMKDIQNLSLLMNEAFDDELQGSGSTFFARFPLYRSMLNVIFSRLENVTSELESLVEETRSISFALK